MVQDELTESGFVLSLQTVTKIYKINKFMLWKTFYIKNTRHSDLRDNK